MEFGRHLIRRVAAAALICAFCAGAVAQQPQPEPAPAGVRFLQSATTLDALRRDARANLSWREADGAELFLWIDTSTSVMTFTLDQAHFIQQGGRQFWAFVDAASAEGLDFNDPVRQFMVQRYLRQRVTTSDGSRDGNHSFVRLLERRSDGAVVYELGYVSRGGARAHQENFRTCLLYRSPGAVWQLATHDIGPDNYNPPKSGNYGEWVSREMRITWASAGAAVPFSVELTETTGQSDGSQSDHPLPSYETYRHGILRGPFPMQLVMEDRQVMRSRGTDSLTAIARLLIQYHSALPEGTDARRIEALWLQALRRANPALDPDQPVASGTEIVIPDIYATAREVARQIPGEPLKAESPSNAGASFDCSRAATPVEKTICSSIQLSVLDNSLATAYKQALAASGNAEAVRARQRGWLANERNKCPDAACIRDAYRQRLAELPQAADPP